MTLLINDFREHTPLEQCQDAWQAFMFQSYRQLQPEDLFADSDLTDFLAWVLFRRLDSGTIPALNTVAWARGDMPVYETIIQAVVDQPYTFWMAGEFEPGRGMPVKDLLLDREFLLTEPVISAISAPGDVFYARVVNINHIDGFFAQGPESLPMTVIPTIQAFRQSQQPKTLDDLHRLDDLTRRLWMRLWDEYDDEADAAFESAANHH